MKYISVETLLEYGKALRYQGEEELEMWYDRMPGIEVVKCKDCKYAQIDMFANLWCNVEALPDVVEPEFYCADGEERDD